MHLTPAERLDCRQQYRQGMFAPARATESKQFVCGTGGKVGSRAGKFDLTRGIWVQIVKCLVKDKSTSVLVDIGEGGFEQVNSTIAEMGGSVSRGWHTRNPLRDLSGLWIIFAQAPNRYE